MGTPFFERRKRGGRDPAAPINGDRSQITVLEFRRRSAKVSGREDSVLTSEDHDGDTYRAVYTIELEGVVYVLHCFQKKSKSGVATPQADIDVIERRLKDARALHAQRNRNEP